MASFGVSLISPSGVTVESIDVENKADHKQLIDSTGHHYGAYTYDHTYPWSARGKGKNPYDIGLTSAFPDIISGKVFILSAKTITNNVDWEGWEISAIGYPNATQ
jgi:hypothetical protein